MAIKCKCKICSTEFIKNDYAVNVRGEGKFCSKDCHNEFQRKDKKRKNPHWLKPFWKNPWNKGKEGIRGEKHYNWKGGITKQNRLLRSRAEWKEWREKVFKRDNYMCQKCASKSGDDGYVRLEPHHIFRIHKLIKHNLLKHIFNVDNGITLCVDCHKTTYKGNY